jgi:hypothetical protein
MKKASRSLKLNRETLRPLTADELLTIGGGTQSGTSVISAQPSGTSVISGPSVISGVPTFQTLGPGCSGPSVIRTN